MCLEKLISSQHAGVSEMEFLLNYPWRLGLLTAVVSVLTASITLQQGGRVDIRDSQPGEVFENLGCLLKRQIPVELKPVASERNLWVFHRHLERIHSELFAYPR